MAEHVWSVLCRRGVVDREGGQISLHEVIEKLIVEDLTDEDLTQLEGGVGLHHPMQLVTWWVRSDYSKPETSSLRLALIWPDGSRFPIVGLKGPPRESSNEEQLEEIPLDLQKHTGARRTLKLQGLPKWGGFGLYWFVVEGQTQEGEWKTATRIPLSVELREPAGEAGHRT